MGVGKTLEELQRDPNFNPDDWEECEEEDSLIVFWWKVVGAMIAITVVGFFFWYLDQMKKREEKKVPEETASPESDDVRESAIHLSSNSAASADVIANGTPSSAPVSHDAKVERRPAEETSGRLERSTVEETSDRLGPRVPEKLERRAPEETTGTSPSVGEASIDGSLQRVKVTDAQKLALDSEYERVGERLFPPEIKQSTQALTSSRSSEHSEEVVFVMKPKQRMFEDEEEESSEEISSEAIQPQAAPPTPSTELELGVINSLPTTDNNNSHLVALREEPRREIVSAPPDAPEKEQSPPIIVPMALKQTPSGKWEEEEEDFEEDEELPSVTTAPEIESFAADASHGGGEDVPPVEELPQDLVPVKLSDRERLEKKLKEQISQEIQDIADHLGGAPPSFVTEKKGAKGRPPKPMHEDSLGFTDDTESSDRKLSSMLEVVGVSSMAEALKKIETLKEVSDIMRKAGLQSSNLIFAHHVRMIVEMNSANLIFGIDYTASNKYQGEMSFGGRSLHSITPGLLNPYQQVITIMGKTLAPFATSGYIPAFGFGDVHTSDWSVFPLKQGEQCSSFDDVLQLYNSVTPKIILSGPTNFAPLIYQAMDICQEVQDYHILVIVADGQVTNERATRRAIVDACKFPLSIVVVGVGDGPWDMMRVFDDSLPKRPWDNFHFVEFYKIMQEAGEHADADLTFAVQSLLEIPDQYKKIKQMGLI